MWFLAAVFPLMLATPDDARGQTQPFVDGSRTTQACKDFRVSLLGLLDVADIPDPGWSLVRNGIPGAPRYPVRSIRLKMSDWRPSSQEQTRVAA